MTKKMLFAQNIGSRKGDKWEYLIFSSGVRVGMLEKLTGIDSNDSLFYFKRKLQ